MIETGGSVRRGLVLTALAAGAALLIAGCRSEATPNLESLDSTSTAASGTTVVSAAPIDDAPPPSDSAPSSSATATTSDSISANEEAARTAAEAQYTKYWEVFAALPHTPEDQWQAMLADVAVEPLITNTQDDARVVRDKGRDTYGQVLHRFSWNEPINGADNALLTDCDDSSRAGAYETATGEKVTAGVERRHMLASMARGDDGVWRVQQTYYLKDEPC